MFPALSQVPHPLFKGSGSEGGASCDPADLLLIKSRAQLAKNGLRKVSFVYSQREETLHYSRTDSLACEFIKHLTSLLPPAWSPTLHPWPCTPEVRLEKEKYGFQTQLCCSLWIKALVNGWVGEEVTELKWGLRILSEFQLPRILRSLLVQIIRSWL